MEVSGYVDHNVSMDAQFGWKVDILNPDGSNIWKAIQSQVRLVHVNTSASMKVDITYCIYGDIYDNILSMCSAYAWYHTYKSLLLEPFC